MIIKQKETYVLSMTENRAFDTVAAVLNGLMKEAHNPQVIHDAKVALDALSGVLLLHDFEIENGGDEW